MPCTCTHRTLRLWVLACFVGALMVSALAPLVRPHALELLCSGNGPAKWVEQTADGPTTATPATAAALAGMDCPLCLPAHVPPGRPTALLQHAVPAIFSRWQPQAPPPPLHRHRPAARAPPVFS
jgi:hypothetical protein